MKKRRGFFNRSKKKVSKPVEKSDLIKFIETNSTIPPTGKVFVISNGKKKTYDYFAPKPTDAILKAFIDTLKLPNVTKYWYE